MSDRLDPVEDTQIGGSQFRLGNRRPICDPSATQEGRAYSRLGRGRLRLTVFGVDTGLALPMMVLPDETIDYRRPACESVDSDFRLLKK